MILNNKILFLAIAFTFGVIALSGPSLADPEVDSEAAPTVEIEEEKMIEMPVVKLRSLDKITARTKTFEAKVGATVKFGPIYIKTQSCRKASPIEKPESAAFLQIWEVDHSEKASWVFSGWMFASSPGLSSMDHPIYDVWVLDCLDQKTEQSEVEKQEDEERGEGELPEDQTPAEPDIKH